jgi:hypothetical protein
LAIPRKESAILLTELAIPRKESAILLTELAIPRKESAILLTELSIPRKESAGWEDFSFPLEMRGTEFTALRRVFPSFAAVFWMRSEAEKSPPQRCEA